MTTLEQAQELLAKLQENDLPKIITFMTDLLDHKQPKVHSTLPDVDPQELLKEFQALRDELSKCPVEDLDTAREAVLSAKYGRYM